MLHIRNISYLLPMCCSFWEKCLNSHKPGQGCSTPLKKGNSKNKWFRFSLGGLTLTWYTYMCVPFGVLFRKIWYTDRGVFIRDEIAQISKLGVFWANYSKKHTQFGQNWVLFYRKLYTDGWVIREKIGIEKVRFSKFGRHIHVWF